MPGACFLGRGKVHGHPTAPSMGVSGCPFLYSASKDIHLYLKKQIEGSIQYFSDQNDLIRI